MKFINIHGMESNGNNSKYKWIKSNYSNSDIVSPDINYMDENPINILDNLNNKINGFSYFKHSSYNNKIVIFGSSIGGFFGYILSVMNPDITTILFNPSLVPFSRLNSVHKMSYDKINLYSYLFNKYMFNFSNDFSETGFGKNLYVFTGKNDNIVNFNTETKGILPNTFKNIYTFDSDHQMKITDEIGNKINEIIKE